MANQNERTNLPKKSVDTEQPRREQADPGNPTPVQTPTSAPLSPAPTTTPGPGLQQPPSTPPLEPSMDIPVRPKKLDQ